MRQTSVTANWNFQLSVASGTYDLIATTSDRVAMRRGIAVNGDLALTPEVDVVTEGLALADFAFTAPNAAPDETLSVLVGLLTATSPNVPTQIYRGPLGTAKAVPDSALITTDIQTASVRAVNGTSFRALRRPFRVGGDPAYVLPPPLGGVQWSVDGGKLSVSWTSLPEIDILFPGANGNAVGGALASEGLQMSSHFIAATGITHITLDTDIPGYNSAWRVNFADSYTRDLTAQQGTEAGVLTTSEITEDVNPLRVNDHPAPRDAHADDVAIPRP